MTRRYLDDADELLQTQTPAAAFLNPTIERYPHHNDRTVLWGAVCALYGVRDHPDNDPTPILVSG